MASSPAVFSFSARAPGASGAERCTLLCRSTPRRCNSVSCGMARGLRPTPIAAARYAAQSLFKIQQAQSWSRKQVIAQIDRCAVHEGDDLMRGAAVVVDLPMGGVVLGECRACAVADKLQRIPRR